jgi:hypothetical protein
VCRYRKTFNALFQLILSRFMGKTILKITFAIF